MARATAPNEGKGRERADTKVRDHEGDEIPSRTLTAILIRMLANEPISQAHKPANKP